jgi:predicted enzyme related to lactoylglutathione lyase
MPRTADSRNHLVLVAVAACIIATSFLSGFTFRTILTHSEERQTMKKVTGIGGIFFKCKDPNKMKEWYQQHLGINTNQYGAVFEWYQGADSTKKGFTTWSPFKETTKYFEPSTKEFMINYRVEDLEGLVEELKKHGVTVVDAIETYDYGKFVHILDPEGNKVELWQPNDSEYEKLGEQLNSKTTK